MGNKLAIRTVLLAAVVAHAFGWYLPVIRDYRGWQAFRVAFSPVWPFENFKIEPGLLLVLSVTSALTNVLFLALATALFLGVANTRWRARGILYAAAAAALLNLHWPISARGAPVTFEVGYFVWVISFALLTLGAFFAAAGFRTARHGSPRS